MIKRSGFWAASLMAAATTVAAGAAPAAAAQPNPEKNALEVEAHTLDCQNGGMACVQSRNGISALRFADATIWRLSPVPRSGRIGRASAAAMPEVVHAVCASHYLGAAGHVHARAIDFTGSSLPSKVTGLPPTKISGQAVVIGGWENGKRALGGIYVRAVAGHATAQIDGYQIANNRNNSRVWGGFRITLTGMVIDTDFMTHKAKPVGMGEMQCSTDVLPVAAPFRGPAPNTFNSEVNDNGDPS